MDTGKMNDLTKLPKWAQAHIEALHRQRDTAVAKLDEYLDSETEANFYQDDILCDETPPRFVKRHIQGHRIQGEFEGVTFTILLRKGYGVEINYGALERHIGDVILQPYTFQGIRLFLPEKTHGTD